MTSTDVTGTATRPAVRPRPEKPLIRVLTAVLTVGCENGLEVAAASGRGDRILLDALTAADVSRWAAVLGVNEVRVEKHPDIGIVITAVDTVYGERPIFVQHIQRTPTIPGGTTE